MRRVHPSVTILHLFDNLARKICQPLSHNPMRRRFMHASAVLFLLRKERPPIITHICSVMLELLVWSDHQLPVNFNLKIEEKTLNKANHERLVENDQTRK